MTHRTIPPLEAAILAAATGTAIERSDCDCPRCGIRHRSFIHPVTPPGQTCCQACEAPQTDRQVVRTYFGKKAARRWKRWQKQRAKKAAFSGRIMRAIHEEADMMAYAMDSRHGGNNPARTVDHWRNQAETTLTGYFLPPDHSVRAGSKAEGCA